MLHHRLRDVPSTVSRKRERAASWAGPGPPSPRTGGTAPGSASAGRRSGSAGQGPERGEGALAGLDRAGVDTWAMITSLPCASADRNGIGGATMTLANADSSSGAPSASATNAEITSAVAGRISSPPTTVSTACSRNRNRVATPKLPPPPQDRPEQLGMGLGVDLKDLPVRGDHLGREQIVDGEAVFADEEPDPPPSVSPRSRPSRCRRTRSRGRALRPRPCTARRSSRPAPTRCGLRRRPPARPCVRGRARSLPRRRRDRPGCGRRSGSPAPPRAPAPARRRARPRPRPRAGR